MLSCRPRLPVVRRPSARSLSTSPTLLYRQHFPHTQIHKDSPFADVQTGPTRTLLPTFTSAHAERQYKKEQLALVFRILHRFKLAEGIAGRSSTHRRCMR